MSVKVEDMINDYEYEYIIELTINKNNLIEHCKSQNILNCDINQYRLGEEFINMHDELTKYQFIINQGYFHIHIDIFKNEYSEYMQWVKIIYK